jgi:hypothetical protein
MRQSSELGLRIEDNRSLTHLRLECHALFVAWLSCVVVIVIRVLCVIVRIGMRVIRLCSAVILGKLGNRLAGVEFRGGTSTRHPPQALLRRRLGSTICVLHAVVHIYIQLLGPSLGTCGGAWDFVGGRGAGGMKTILFPTICRRQRTSSQLLLGG